MSSTYAPKHRQSKAERSAENRRQWHVDQVNSAEGFRNKIWKLAGWLVAELRRLTSDDEREAWIERFTDFAEDLNRTNGGERT